MKIFLSLVLLVLVTVVAVLVFALGGERASSEPSPESAGVQQRVEAAQSRPEELLPVSTPLAKTPTREEAPVTGSPRKRPPAPAESDNVTISGRVVDEDGVPVEGAWVSLQRRASSGAGRAVRRSKSSTTSDADGRFRLEQVERAEWNLQATDEELLESLSATVDTSAGSQEVELVGKRGHVLLVRARWDDGTFAELQSLHLDYPGGSKSLSASPGGGRADEGQRIPGLPAGELQVRAGAERHGRIGRGVAKVIVPDETQCEVLLREVAPVVVRGSVRDSRGAPVQGVLLSLTSANLQEPASAISSGAGTFELRGLEEGPAVLRLVTTEHYWPEARTGRRVELAADMPALEIVLEPGASVRGQVLDERGVPLLGARVLGGQSQATTDAEGSFELALQPGKRILYALARGHARSVNEEVQLEPGGTLEGVVLHLRTACRVSGRVFDADGQPMPGATVFAGAGEGTTDKQGQFLLDDLPPGTIVLQANDDDDGFTRQLVVTSSSAATHVELRFPPRSPVPLRLELREHGQAVDVVVQVNTSGFLRTASSSAARVELELQTPGRWRGVLKRAGAAEDDFSAKRLFELDVVVGEPCEATLELGALPVPADAAEIAAWLDG